MVYLSLRMFAQLVVVACLLVSALAEEVILDHAPEQALYEQTILTTTCLPNGALQVSLATKNKAKSTIAFGGKFANLPLFPAGCTSDELVFPGGAADTTLDFATTAARTCSREVVNNNQFKWSVVVVENLEYNAVVHKQYISEIDVLCVLTTGDIPSDGTDTDVIPVEIPDASDEHPVAFKITRTEGLPNKKWEFVLSPDPVASIGDLNFKIQSCTVVPTPVDGGGAPIPVDPSIKLEIILGGCIADRSTDVAFNESPEKQSITVYPFQFTAFPTANVKVTCQVALCEAEGCEEIERCVVRSKSRQSPVIRRTRRSVAQTFSTSVTV